MDTKFKVVPIAEFCSLQRGLLQKEHIAEISESEAVLAEDSRTEVATRGIAILNVRFDSISPSLFGKSVLLFKHHLSYSRKKESNAVFPQHSLSSGDIVGVFQDSFKSAPVVKGVIHSIDSNSVKLIPDGEFEDIRLNDNESYDIARIGSKVTHERLTRTLDSLEKSHHSLMHYMFEDDSAVPMSGLLVPLTDLCAALNQPQRSAVQNALSNSLITVVHGPAGTGKTTTLASIIAESTRADPNIKILACAPSNVAVDNLATRVLSLGICSIVRIGHPVRVDASLLDHTLDSLVRKSDYYESCRDIESELGSMLSVARPQWSEIRQLRKELKSRQSKSIQDVFGRSNVVFATCNGSYKIVDKFFSADFKFDVCVIDECAQGLEISSWIPILQSRRVVLGGDHKQLPATVKSVEAAEEGLGISLFERVHARFDNLAASPGEINNLLTVQYRMNEIIMGWSNREFYKNKLHAHESNRHWTLEPTVPAILNGLIDLTSIVKCPFVFCDTAGVDGMGEQSLSSTSSKYNMGEVVVVRKYLDLVLASVSKSTQVSIISPYLMQTEKLKEAVDREEVEVSTVDSFQGRENDLIILSLVRSNPAGTVGFLSDYRRLNVAVTRARKQIMIVGDSETISHDPILKSLFEYATEFGTVISAQSFIVDSDLHALEGSAVRVEKVAKKIQKKVMDRAPTIREAAASAAAPVHEDDLREKFEAQIISLGQFEKFFFPPTLSGASRKLIHDICEKAGYGHGSVGEGGSRQIWVQKQRPLAQSPPPVKIVEANRVKNPTTKAAPVKPSPIPQPTKTIEPKQEPVPVKVKNPGICPHDECQMSIRLVSLDCQHCSRSFCIAHATPECHGCGDAAKRSARANAKAQLRKLKNPPIILPQGKGGVSTEQLRNKMHSKLKSLEAERKKSHSKR